MTEQPKITVTVQPDSAEMQALEQRLEAAGLPADGTPDGMATPTGTPPLLTPANVQTGAGVIKDQLPHQSPSEQILPQAHARDQENQHDSAADSLPQG